MSTEDQSPYAFDPFDPAQTHDQWEQLALLRREAPVSRPIPGFVYVARYADVKSVFSDAELFSSREGFRGEGIVVPPDESFLGELDPPDHPRARALLAQAFRPGLADRSETFTRQVTEDRLRHLADAGAGDLVSQLGVYLPAAVTAHALGIPEEQIDAVVAWSAELLESTWPQTNATERGEGLEGAFPEFSHFLDEQIGLRRKNADAPDDLITRMVRAKERGRVLSAIRIRTICVNSLLASQSTANLIGNLLARFLSDDDFARKLASDPDRVPAAVEESLRFEPPVLFLFRTAMRDTELGGHRIEQGERVILGVASGNRDESVYDRADEFWLERGWPGAPEHLTFAPGPHFCLGSDLARMQARVVMETVSQRFEAGSVRPAANYRRELVPAFIEYGPARLDVEFAAPMLEAPAALPEAATLFAPDQELLLEVDPEPEIEPVLEVDPEPEVEPVLEVDPETETETETEPETAREEMFGPPLSDDLEIGLESVVDAEVDSRSETEGLLDEILGEAPGREEEAGEIDEFLSPPDDAPAKGASPPPKRPGSGARRRRRRR